MKCGDEVDDTEEEGVSGGRPSISKARRGGQYEGAKAGRRGGKGTQDGGSTHTKLMRKAAKKSGVKGKFGEGRGEGTELADEKPE